MTTEYHARTSGKKLQKAAGAAHPYKNGYKDGSSTAPPPSFVISHWSLVLQMTKDKGQRTQNPIPSKDGMSLISLVVPAFKANVGVTSVVLGIFAALPFAFAAPAKALQVEVNPPAPQLGDTISVVVNLDNPANGSNVTVTNGDQTYPAYEIAPLQYRALIPTTPLEKAGTRTFRIAGVGQVQNLSVQVRDRKFPVQRINLPPGKAGVKATEYELKRAAEFRAVQTPEKFWDGPFVAPNKGRITTIYGVRRYYNGKFADDYYHRGVDYAGGAGSPVVAPAAGKVVLVGKVSQGFRVHGNVVGIDHGQGVASIFMHLSRINVKEGDFVKPGQLIGAVGSTGASTGPHLHWGLYVNGKSVDPVPWRNQAVK